MSDLVEKLQNKTRTYKKQIEDAEEIAALNLAKFRKAQQQLEEVTLMEAVLVQSSISVPPYWLSELWLDLSGAGIDLLLVAT